MQFVNSYIVSWSLSKEEANHTAKVTGLALYLLQYQPYPGQISFPKEN